MRTKLAAQNGDQSVRPTIQSADSRARLPQLDQAPTGVTNPYPRLRSGSKMLPFSKYASILETQLQLQLQLQFEPSSAASS